jgi:hypothetical protein
MHVARRVRWDGLRNGEKATLRRATEQAISHFREKIRIPLGLSFCSRPSPRLLDKRQNVRYAFVGLGDCDMVSVAG